jgi:putative toxin-antitoxin system antitoxin component (TIGR02293 family)
MGDRLRAHHCRPAAEICPRRERGFLTNGFKDETIVPTMAQTKAPAISWLLAGNKAKDLSQAAREGVSPRALERLAETGGLSRQELASALGVSIRTLDRHKQKGSRLGASESDRAVRLAHVLNHAFDVFGNRESVADWLHGKIRALGHRRPVEFLDTHAGITEVDHILGRIDHGIIG